MKIYRDSAINRSVNRQKLLMVKGDGVKMGWRKEADTVEDDEMGRKEQARGQHAEY